MSSPAPEVTIGLAAVRSWCGWHIAPSLTETVKVESEGGRVLLLPSLHVTDVTEIRDELGRVVTGWKWRENGIVRGSWVPEELYEIDLVHGYDELPIELGPVVTSLDTGQGRVDQRTTGPFTESYSYEDQPVSTQAVVDRYRIRARP